MIASQYSTLNRQILPAMEENGLKLVQRYEDLNEKQSKFRLDKYFEKEVYPVLTPMAVDFFETISTDQQQDFKYSVH